MEALTPKGSVSIDEGVSGTKGKGKNNPKGSKQEGDMEIIREGNGIIRSGISCLYANARSLINKLEIYRAKVTDRGPDVIGITETWAKEKVSDDEFNFGGEYKCYRQDRVDRIGGG